MCEAMADAPLRVQVANEERLKVHGVGTLMIKGNQGKLPLEEVLYVPQTFEFQSLNFKAFCEAKVEEPKWHAAQRLLASDVLRMPLWVRQGEAMCIAWAQVVKGTWAMRDSDA